MHRSPGQARERQGRAQHLAAALSRAPVEAERVRLDSIELEKAAKQQEALRRDLERRDEIEALRREIDRLERELDKAKAKKGHGHAQGASSAAAPVSSFTSSIFNAF